MGVGVKWAFWLALLQGGGKLVSVSGDSFVYPVDAEPCAMSHFT